MTTPHGAFAPRVVPERAGARRLFGIVATTVLVVSVALAVYRPWTPSHLSVRDQVLLLAALPHADPWPVRLDGLLERLRNEGRFYPVSAALLIAYGEFFGRDAATWQWARLALTVLGAALAFVTLRRLGAAALAAIVGAALFLVGESVVQATNYVLVWESHGIPLFLGATFLASRYQTSRRPVRRAAAISLLMVLAIWAKEPFLACVPFVLLVGLFHDGGGSYRVPTVSKRNALLVCTLGVAVAVLCLAPILITKMGVRSGGHATHYSASLLTAQHAADVAKVMLALSTRAAHYPTNALLYGLVLAASLLVLRGREARTALMTAGIALSLPLAGMLIYLPWGFTPGYYGLPFLLGPALLVALAITILERRSTPRMRGLPIILAGIALAYAAIAAFNTTSVYYAHTHVEGEVAQSLARARAQHAFVVGVRDPVTSGNFGEEVAAYARALGANESLRIVDVACGTAGEQASAEHGVILFTHWCPDAGRPRARPAAIVEQPYRTIDWKSLRPSTTTLYGEVWGL